MKRFIQMIKDILWAWVYMLGFLAVVMPIMQLISMPYWEIRYQAERVVNESRKVIEKQAATVKEETQEPDAMEIFEIDDGGRWL